MYYVSQLVGLTMRIFVIEFHVVINNVWIISLFFVTRLLFAMIIRFNCVVYSPTMILRLTVVVDKLKVFETI